MVKQYLTVAAETSDLMNSSGKCSGSIAVAGLREKVSAVLQSMSESLRNNLLYRHLMRNILWNKSIDRDRELSYIPVAYCVSENVKNDGVTCRCFVSDIPGKDSILASVNSYVSQNETPKAISDEEMKLIDQAFSYMVQVNYESISNRDEYQERVYTEICRLWKSGYPLLKQV